MTAFQTLATNISKDARRRKAIARECEFKALCSIWTHPHLTSEHKVRITKNIQRYVNMLVDGIDAEGLN